MERQRDGEMRRMRWRNGGGGDKDWGCRDRGGGRTKEEEIER